eukprot:TRINITY_DN5284_c0_g1_i11.p1 TRINITY_DN5284_c0_g1~~TRINITY_DN5284_c0_g1_i11.p1  ORF type:complete len:314 (-),score=35.73 TRINITY_DN5284_c0_g1_i11:100-1041(-)
MLLLTLAWLCTWSQFHLANGARPPKEEDYSYNEYPVSISLGILFGVVIPIAWCFVVGETPKDQRKSPSSLLLSLDYYKYYLTLGWVGPIFSIFGSVIYSMIFHFDHVTRTHCKVPNPLPSISAATGNKIPERFFFRFGILVHSSQRIVDGILIYIWFKNRLPPTLSNMALNRLMFWFHLAENFCLWGLTYIGTNEYYMYHEKSFVFWLIFQGLKCLLHIILFPRAVPNPSPYHAKYFSRRKWVFVTNIFCLVLALSLFGLHNTVCIPYLYALFALVEYVVVCTNIYFNYLMSLMLGEGDKIFVDFRIGLEKKD